jgi:segregation and condensation protein A
MEDKTVPWWRRALSYALDGIRTGFGLFSRSSKSKAAIEPEIATGNEENPDKEAELTSHSPQPEPIADAETEAEAVLVPEASVATAEPETPVEAVPEPSPVQAFTPPVPESEPESTEEPVATNQPTANCAPEESDEKVPTPQAADDLNVEGGGGFNPRIESTESPRALQAAEELARVVGRDFSPGIAPTKWPRALAPEVCSSGSSLKISPFPAASLAPEELTSQISPEISSFTAGFQIDPADEAATVEESPVEAESTTEVASSNEVDPAQVEYPIDAFDRTAEFEDAPEADPEEDLEPGAEFEIEAEPEPEPEFEPDLDPEPEPEPEFESDLDPAPEPEVEAVAETDAPPAIEKHPPADEPMPEPTAASEELIHPAIEATLEQTVVQPAEVEIESIDEAAPAVETTPVAEQATEQATEIFPEPATMPMDLTEPIPEQATEPTHEVAPDPVVPVEARIEAPAVAVAPGPAQEPAAIPSAAPPDASADEPTPPPPPAPKPFIKLESRDNEADLSPFSVVVSQVYDGPLDLLLDLIRKQDIDIYDIPIARITSQFLGYVNQLKATDVDVAGEFIYIASLLIHIKSKMLLPRAPAGPDDAAEDPRRELVERLLEHERFKNAAQMLQQKQMLEAATWSNPGLREFQDDASAEPEIAADTVDLVRIFRDILERARNRPVINLQEDSVTVGQMIQFLSRRLTMEDKPVALRRLLSHTRSERALIAMFLALLELVRLQAVLLRQDRAFSEIFIKKHVGFENVMNDGLANARDDWR